MAWCKHRKEPADPACSYCQDKHDEREWIVTFSQDPFARYRELKRLQAQLASKDELLKAQELVVAEKDAALAVASEGIYEMVCLLANDHVDAVKSPLSKLIHQVYYHPAISKMSKRLAADQRVFEAARAYVNWTAMPKTDLGYKLVDALKSREGL